MKLISFVVPCYNSEAYMEKCINSLIPGGDDVEIIIINDGSKDRTGEIADRFASKYPSLIKVIHQENAGVSVARNHGIEVSEGEYLVFVDGDDYVLENHLSELYVEGYDFNLTRFAKKHDNELFKSSYFTFNKTIIYLQ